VYKSGLYQNTDSKAFPHNLLSGLLHHSPLFVTHIIDRLQYEALLQ